MATNINRVTINCNFAGDGGRRKGDESTDTAPIAGRNDQNIKSATKGASEGSGSGGFEQYRQSGSEPVGVEGASASKEDGESH